MSSQNESVDLTITPMKASIYHLKRTDLCKNYISLKCGLKN